MSWFKKNIPITFCDILRHEISDALKSEAIYKKASKEWYEYQNNLPTVISCKDYTQEKSKGNILWNEVKKTQDEYWRHMDYLQTLIHSGDTVRVDNVDGLTYDLIWIGGPLSHFIQIKEVKDVKTD